MLMGCARLVRASRANERIIPLYSCNIVTARILSLGREPHPGASWSLGQTFDSRLAIRGGVGRRLTLRHRI